MIGYMMHLDIFDLLRDLPHKLHKRPRHKSEQEETKENPK